MDQFEFTKIAGAVLAALLLIFATKTIIEMNVGHTPEKPGYQLPTAKAEGAKPENGATAEAGAPAAANPEAAGKQVVTLLPKADAGKRQGHLQEMSRLPCCREGQGPDRRSQSLGRREPSESVLSAGSPIQKP